MSKKHGDIAEPEAPAPNAAFEMVGLTALMGRTAGSASVAVGLIDGPLSSDAPHLEMEHIHGTTTDVASMAAADHAARVAAILMGTRSGPAPGICPGCTLLIHPVLTDGGDAPTLNATHGALAEAILAAVDARADVLNLSVGLLGRSTAGERRIQEALDHAMRRGVLVIAAAGNEGRFGGSVLTGHPWVVPVAAYGLDATPMGGSYIGRSVALRGLSAPGEEVLTLRGDGEQVRSSGTSIATSIVAGTAALLWSAFPSAPASDVRRALTGLPRQRRSIVPPLLEAEAAYRQLESAA